MDSVEPSTKKQKTGSHINKIALAGFLLIGIAAGIFLQYSKEGIKIQAAISGVDKTPLDAFPVVVPTMKYGFALDTFSVYEGEIQPNQVLGTLLEEYRVDYPTLEKILQQAKGVFDIRQLKPGRPYMVLSTDQGQSADYFVYEPNVYEYIVFSLKGDCKVEKTVRPITTQTRTAKGVLESSLWQTMTDNGLSYELTDKMEDALQWSIDFHHLQKGDEFQLVYDENYIEGQEVGVGKVYAARYQTGSNEYHAIWYENGEHKGYYDLEGRPMKKGFLKAPVKYSRISSYYNLNRFHPILKRTRPHYGTDYAAPYGTPIMAVGDGVILEASYTSGNGNYVKIKHDDTYTTQYLHMQKFASGIRSGAHVQQGQVIGYVGSTGLATGPHVCFRFWKSGKQVNHLALSFPPPKPLPAEELPKFQVVRDQYMAYLEKEECDLP